jgi:DNA-binding transcriptional MerR regulator
LEEKKQIGMVNKFSIKDLERLSGIKAHTIRIWEQRYHIFNPERTDTNIRYYSNEELKLLLNISLLNNNGYKISKIAQLSSLEITSEAGKILTSKLDESILINNLVISMIELNEEAFEEILNNCITNIGFENSVLHVIYPFLEKIGIMWQTGSINPAQEHFMSNLIRRKFITAIDHLKLSLKDSYKTFVLFLPDGELHELSLLFCNYVIRKIGHKCVYLGQSVPFEDLEVIENIINPDYLLTIMINQPKEISVQDYANKLSNSFPSCKIIMTGYQVVVSGLKSFGNVYVPHSTKDLTQYIASL